MGTWTVTAKDLFVGCLARRSAPAPPNKGLYAVILAEPNNRLSHGCSHLLGQKQLIRAILTSLVASLDQAKARLRWQSNSRQLLGQLPGLRSHCLWASVAFCPALAGL